MNPIFSIATHILSSAADALMCKLFLDISLGKPRKSYPLWLWILSLTGMELALSVNLFLHGHFPVLFASACATLLSLFCTYLVTCFYDTTLQHRLFTVLAFQLIAALAETINTLCCSYFFEYSVAQSDVFENMLCSLLNKPFYAVLIFLIALLYRHRRQPVLFRYNMLLLFVPVSGILILLFLTPMLIASPTAVNWILYFLIFSAICFLCLFGYQFLEYMQEQQELRERTLLLDHLLQIQQQKYDDAIASYRSTRSILHDTNKHLLTIHEYAQHREPERIAAYTEQLIEELFPKHHMTSSGNLSVDALLNNAMTQLEALGAAMTPELSLESGMSAISDYSLCIILGNLLDNAVQAIRHLRCSASATLQVSLLCTETTLTIRTVNPVDSPEDYEIFPDELVHQADLPLHGYGLINISRETARYGGSVSVLQQGGLFYVTVVLPIPRKKEEMRN